MKRSLRVLTAMLLITILTVACTACSSAANVTPVEKITDVFTEESVTKTFDEFLGNGENARRNRTSFSDNEKVAAQYISSVLEGYGYENGSTLETQDISVEIINKYNSESNVLNSQNVIATYNEGKPKLVVIGANYDNMYSGVSEVGVGGDGGEGALGNVTGVATLLELAKAFNTRKPALDFTVKFAFYGAGEIGAFGSGRFIAEYLNGGANVLLAVNLYALAGQKLEVYADETDTIEDELFVESGEKYDTVIERLSRTTPLFPQQYATNITYSHIGLMSSQVSFFEKDIPSISIFGGDYDGFSYRNYKPDTLDSFRRDFIGYAKVMTDAASLVYGVVTSAEFAVLAPSFAENRYDYSFFTESLYADFALLGVVVFLSIVLVIVVNLLGRSKPNGKKLKIKIAVFGMDYEEKTDNVIYVDTLRDDSSGAGGDNKNNPVDPFD